MSDTLRLFIGFELAEPARAALVEAQERLRRGGFPVRWVEPATMHLTLQFLGATDPARLPAITAAMEATLAGHRPLQLRLGAAGAFPSLRRPSVVWVGVGGDVHALGRVQSDLASALEPLGFEREERPYHAHLTLGRALRDAPADRLAALGEAIRALPDPPAAEWTATRAVLFESELLPGGPRYTERAAAPLGQG